MLRVDFGYTYLQSETIYLDRLSCSVTRAKEINKQKKNGIKE